MKYMPLSRTETQVVVRKHRQNLYCVALHMTILAGFKLGYSPYVKKMFFLLNLTAIGSINLTSV